MRRVVSTSPRKDLSESSKVVIPGYANLREFSRDAERVLKEECGSFWESYFQRGHWRMILPFSRAHQRDTADQLMSVLRQNRPPVVHVACFPSLRINHGLLLFAFEETESQIRFAAYDPNYPEQPTTLTFRRDTSRFELPGNTYFPGGRVSAYEVYCGPCY